MAEPYPDPDRDRTGNAGNGGTLTGSLESRGRRRNQIRDGGIGNFDEREPYRYQNSANPRCRNRQWRNPNRIPTVIYARTDERPTRYTDKCEVNCVFT